MKAGRIRPIMRAGAAEMLYKFHTYIRTLRSVFSPAVRWGYLTANPFSGVPLPAQRVPMPYCFTVEEIGAILDELHRSKSALSDYVEMLLWTGLRRSELTGLQWSHISMEERLIRLPRTKTNRPRMIPMVRRVQEILTRRRDLPQPFAGVKPNSISQAFRRTLRKLNIAPGASLHDLRGTFETYMMEIAGISESVANKITGHSAKVAKVHYIGMPQKEVMRKMSRLDKLLPKRNSS